jgi:hypothetical protein
MKMIKHLYYYKKGKTLVSLTVDESLAQLGMLMKTKILLMLLYMKHEKN